MLAVKLIVGAFVFALIAVPMWLVFDNVMTPLEDVANNSTSVSTEARGYIQGVYSLIRTVVTLGFVICFIGGFIAYIVERAAMNDRYRGGDYRG